MRSRIFLVSVFGGVLLASFSRCAVGQSHSMPSADSCKDDLVGTPYTLEFRLIDMKPQDGGAMSTYYYYDMIARDSKGRSMSATTMPSTSETKSRFVSSRICDPVEHRQILTNSLLKKAVVLQMPLPEQQHGCWVSDSSDFTINFDQPSQSGVTPRSENAATNLRREDLGSSTLQGLEVHGYRSSWPPVAPGEPDPPYLVAEHWVAPSLGGVWVQQEVQYPSRLNWTMKWARELASFNPADPDPSLFQIPNGYQTVAEAMHPVSCHRAHHSSPPQQPRLH